LPPLSCNITTTLLPVGTAFPFSKAFKNFGTKSDAVASDPTCKNSLRLINIELFLMITVYHLHIGTSTH